MRRSRLFAFSDRKGKTLGEVFWAGCCVATPPRERARKSLRAAPTFPFSLMSCCHGEGCSGEVGVSWRQRGRHPGRCCSAGVCHMFSPQIFTTSSGGSRVLPWFLQPPSASATTSVVRVNLTPFPTCENQKLRDFQRENHLDEYLLALYWHQLGAADLRDATLVSDCLLMCSWAGLISRFCTSHSVL